MNEKFIGTFSFKKKRETNNNRQWSRHSQQSDPEKEDRKQISKKKDRTLKKDSTRSIKKTIIGGLREYEHSKMLTDMINVWQANACRIAVNLILLVTVSYCV